MKLLIAALALVSFSVMAEEDICLERAYKPAYRIMQARQVGIPMPEVMATAPTDLWKQIIIRAYQQAQYMGDEYRERVSKEFANEIYMLCLTYKEA